MFGNRTTVEFAKVSDVTEIGNLSRKYIENDLGWKYTPDKLKKLIKNRSKKKSKLL